MLTVLSKKDAKKLFLQINDYYGSNFFPEDGLLKTEQDKLYIVTKDAWNFDLEKIRVKQIGIYFGQIMASGEIRLSIEGSQILGKTASKRVIEIDDEKANSITHSEKFNLNFEVEDGFYIVKYKGHIIGCVKAVKNIIYNYIPKSRRSYV